MKLKKTQDTVPYEMDAQVQDFVKRHPHGADYPSIAEVFGVTPQCVHIQCERALAKLRVQMDAVGAKTPKWMKVT